MIAIRGPRLRHWALMLGALLAATTVTACTGAARGGTAGAPETYYVSPSGNDSSAGTTPATAWQTLHKASSVPLPAGSKILLQGGQRFTGSLYIGNGDRGTSSAPIVIGTYGDVPATIHSPSGDGILVHDVGGVNIQDIDLIGSPGPGDGDGIDIYNDLPAGHRLDHIGITDVNATGFTIGIAISGKNNGAGFADVQVSDSQVQGNINAGIATFGPQFNPQSPTYANSNVVISHVTAADNLGNPLEKTRNTGNGIVLGSVQGATVNWSVAAKNGGAGAAVQGPGGIWAYDSTDVDIEHNLAYANRTRDRVDGNGFGLDQNTSHSVLQYNLSYGNDGAGFLIYSSLDDGAARYNTVRDNISSYDARGGNPFYGGICVIGHVANVSVYQNTVVMEPTTIGTPPLLRLGADLKYVVIANNIFTTVSGPIIATAAAPPESSVKFQGNDYFSEASPWKVLWGDTTYGSLSAWQAGTGRETPKGQPTGFAVAPEFTGPVFGLSASTPADIADVQGFMLKAGSPLIGAGLAVANLGLTPTPVNYAGQPQSRRHPDVGAM